MKTLKEYADENRIHYRTAWNRYKAGLIPGSFKNEYGKILLPDDRIKPEYVVCYARVSSSQNRKNLEAQAERLVSYCNAKGYAVKEVVKECASGLNDKRPKLVTMLKNPRVSHIVVEHSDRLTRFGLNYIELWMASKNCKIEVMNEAANDRDDLMQDFVNLVTSFVVRLYGQRRSKRRTEKLIEAVRDEDDQVE